MRHVKLLAVAAVLASAFLSGLAIAGDDAAPAAEAASGKITKSRSNIQNNRAAPPAEAADGATSGSPEPAAVQKTKTRSNQSND